ncbi:MAG: ABC transporter permease [Hespellia sp.]|nr:ABC transporter permease [Hespellia sp.]
MGQFGEYVKMAVDNIMANKGRSILTMLGIIIGISSVITVVSVGNGVKKDVEDSSAEQEVKTVQLQSKQDGMYQSLITMDDVAVLKKQLGDRQKGVTVSGSGSGQLTTVKGDFPVSINYTVADEANDPNTEGMLVGNYFTEDDEANANAVAVITKAGAMNMFGNTNVVGMSIDVTIDKNIQTFDIVGVEDMTEDAMQAETMTMMGEKPTITVKTPYTVSETLGDPLEEFSSVTIILSSSEEADNVEKIAKQVLTNRHMDEDATFEKYDLSILMDSLGSLLDAVTYFVALVAAISLLVGGIGVMNIMLVSVTERTREIGIRKALGARISSIITQFLCEAAIISGLGGVIGIIIGFAFAKLIGLVSTSFHPVVSMQSVILATAFSCGIGVIFGIYPARKAAKLSPIEALRQL